MKAIVIHGYGGPEVLKYEDYPDPVPAVGEVLVRVAASSVNPFDFKIRSGALKDFFPLTFLCRMPARRTPLQRRVAREKSF